MSLEQLTKQIAMDARSEAKRIVDEAKKKAKEMVKEAETQKKKLLQKAEKNAREAAVLEKAEAIAAARIEAKRIVEEARAEKAEQALAAVWKEFVKQAEGNSYPHMLRFLIHQGLESIGPNAIVMVNERDVSTAKQAARKAIVKKAGIEAGAIISAEDGKIIVNNSFEGIFADKRNGLKAQLFLEMFGSGKK